MELSLLLTLCASDPMPLHRQLYQQIRDAILTGNLKPQMRLPASRQLAKTLNVSRTTVVQSYDQLISEGYLQTKPGAGTFVCSQIPDGLIFTSQTTANVPVADRLDADPSDLFAVSSAQTASGLSNPLERLSAYGTRLTTIADYDSGADSPLSFRYGLPDLSLFPVRQWRRLLNRQATKNQQWMGYNVEPMGHVGLRREISQYISEIRAVRCQPEQILMTGGTQQALSLMVQILMDVGEVIAVEDPGYLSAKRIFSAGGATVVPVPVDDDGIRVNEPGGLADIAADNSQPTPRLVYVTPSHQFPTGVLMTLSRRLALLHWARQNGALIIEDDYDSEFRYSGSPIPALQGLDEHNCVLYVGTFSKVMFPGLRLGYVVVPPALIDVFRRAKWLCDRQCPLIEQAALAEFIKGGYLAQHIRRMRSVYDRRRRSLVDSLQQAAPGVNIPGDASGLHILARFQRERQGNETLLTQALIDRAQELGVGLFSAGPHYWIADRTRLGRHAVEKEIKTSDCELIFGFGNISEANIKSAIARISPTLWPVSGN
ncbi:MAG: PLP-dependent aminotransferase family protein [Leptolyngbya foveolarum]|uniref:PLP-dependent aminotransferase family protein n=1 Tax=Leptolyngbya foveolarum TaxID=47253 RepID=A0A2W4VT29_9CYAN|nr:MAG: PLP-dependent aminotransferase family protein [Leptolyngbya foveolarum]